MTWIVWKEENGKIKLISKVGVNGMIPKGAYLTVDDPEQKCRFILRIDDSQQKEPFEPSPLIIDLDISAISADRQCKNIVTAYRVRTIENGEDDGLVRYIRPLSVARRSTQEEIDCAMEASANLSERGPPVFVATVYANENRILREENGKYITAHLPKSFYFHQTMICGKTGSGKTVAMKYLAQYFIEEMNGAVLAINVKEADFLKMDMPSRTNDKNVLREWESLDRGAHPIYAFTVYHPANEERKIYKSLSADLNPITLNVKDIEPEALIGAIQGITDRASMSLPDIFRHWRDKKVENRQTPYFRDFLRYLNDEHEKKSFETKNELGDPSSITLHPGTYQNIINSLTSASKFFDNERATMLNAEDILDPGKMSVIDVAESTQFGALVLRDILKRLVRRKNETNETKTDVPLLIIIDEVHQFYNTSTSREALGDLDVIGRTGRSRKIGVFFASQNPGDMPSGLSSVVNTKIFFKTEAQSAKELGIKITADEMDALRRGFAVVSVHDLPQLRVVKFPLSYSGVLN